MQPVELGGTGLVFISIPVTLPLPFSELSLVGLVLDVVD